MISKPITILVVRRDFPICYCYQNVEYHSQEKENAYPITILWPVWIMVCFNEAVQIIPFTVPKATSYYSYSKQLLLFHCGYWTSFHTVYVYFRMMNVLYPKLGTVVFKRKKIMIAPKAHNKHEIRTFHTV